MVKRLLLSHAFLGLLVFFGACTTSVPLSRAEASRIADTAASDYLHRGLQQYKRSSVDYLSDEHAWRIRYALKRTGVDDFAIQVEDETKKAFVIASDPASAFSPE